MKMMSNRQLRVSGTEATDKVESKDFDTDGPGSEGVPAPSLTNCVTLLTSFNLRVNLSWLS